MAEQGSVIFARWLWTPKGVIEDGAIELCQGKINRILEKDEARRLSGLPGWRLPHHLLLPGLVNAHTHAAMALFRGLADDLPLMHWLKERIWPAEEKSVCPEMVEDGTRLAIAEMIRSGVTAFNDQYFYPEAAAKAVIESGIRARLGLVVLDMATAYAKDAKAYLDRGLDVIKTFAGEPLVSFSLAPHAPYTVEDGTFREVAFLAEEHDLSIHLHLHETQEEILESLARHGTRPMERLWRLGLVCKRLLAVHAVHLSGEEIGLLALQKARVAHCPTSNLKLASGLAPLAKLVVAGVPVGLGTDGAASNNRLDVLGEARLAALLAKGTSGDAQALAAPQALSLATGTGALAVGFEQAGVIVPGMAADLIAMDLSRIETTPLFDPLSQALYAAGRESVTHLWVCGQALMENRELKTLDEEAVLAKAAWWQKRIGAQNGR